MSSTKNPTNCQFLLIGENTKPNALPSDFKEDAQCQNVLTPKYS